MSQPSLSSSLISKLVFGLFFSAALFSGDAHALTVAELVEGFESSDMVQELCSETWIEQVQVNRRYERVEYTDEDGQDHDGPAMRRWEGLMVGCHEYEGEGESEFRKYCEQDFLDELFEEASEAGEEGDAFERLLYGEQLRPHFWAMDLIMRNSYEGVGVPSEGGLPIVDEVTFEVVNNHDLAPKGCFIYPQKSEREAIFEAI